MQIAPSIHRIGGFVNQYLIIDGKELTLIDTGMRPNAKNILKYINSLGFKPSDVKRILITHSDPDHYGAAKDLKDSMGCEIWSTQLEADAMKTATTSRVIEPKGFFKLLIKIVGPFMMATPPVETERILIDGETLPILSGLQVIASPGHTPGHVSFYLPAERILIAGDAIKAKNGQPVATTDSTTGDPVQAVATAKKLMDLNPLVYACGHAFIDIRNKS
jgi:glyoxylase-like metal-dependent hydrolase (beta-lactamase superfamily II)